MKKSLKNLSIAVVVVVMSVGIVHAQDRQLENQINRIGFKFNYDQNTKRYNLIFEVSEGRTQILYINEKTYDAEGFKIREIYSPVATLQNKTDFSHRVLFNLLEKNYEYKIGSWQIHGGEPPFQLQYSIRVNDKIEDNHLRELIKLAVKVADAMELELTGTDDF